MRLRHRQVAGDNLVQIIVDEEPPGTNDFWCAAIPSGQLVVDGGGVADASCRFIETDRAEYEFGETVEVTVEVDTVAGSQTVVVETNVLDAGVVNTAGETTSGTINGAADDAFQANLALPLSGTGGAGVVEALIFDQATGLFQDRCTQPIRIVPPCYTYEDLRQAPPASPAELGLGRVSDEEELLEVAGNTAETGVVAPLAGPLVRRVRWWGFSLESNGSFLGECLDDQGTAFNFYFYADDGGAPGNLIASRLNVVPAEIFATGFCCFGGASVYRYDAEFDPPVVSDDVRWIGIRREVGNPTPGGNSCLFLWVSESDPDLYDNFHFWRDLSDPTVNLSVAGDDNLFCVDASSIFLDGFESGNLSAWSNHAP